MTKDTVAIIGSHPRTREQFDFDRTDCDIWLFNEALSNKDNSWAKRADLIFQIHVPAIWRNPANRNDPHHYDWLKTQNDCDVMMQDIYPDVPRSQRYPLTEILSMLNNDPDHFLTSSVPQAIALAIWLQYKRIEVYGVAMETNTEYQFQREGVSFWKGFAQGRGIDFYFADTTFRAPLYGYEGKVSVEYERFEKRIEALKPDIERLTQIHAAALLDAKKAIDIFVADGSKPNENTLFDVVGRLRGLGEQLGVLDGARQENERYKRKADKMREAAEGEFVFSRQEFESSAKNNTDRASQAHTEFIAAGTHLGIVQDNLRASPRGSQKRQKLAVLFAQTMAEYLQRNNRAAIYRGAAQENYNYMAHLDKYIRAAGGAKAEAVLLAQEVEHV